MIGLLLINLGMVTFLFLQKQPHQPTLRPPLEDRGPGKLIIERLHFDNIQVAKYEQLISQHQSAIKLLNYKIRTVRNDLYVSLSEESFKGRDSLIALLTQLHKQVENTHYDHFAAIRKICKSNQLTDFDNLTQDLARFFSPQRKEGRPPED